MSKIAIGQRRTYRAVEPDTPRTEEDEDGPRLTSREFAEARLESPPLPFSRPSVSSARPTTARGGTRKTPLGSPSKGIARAFRARDATEMRIERGGVSAFLTFARASWSRS